MEVNVACCHPGYHFDDEREVCRHNHNDSNIVRPDTNNRYLYTKVMDDKSMARCMLYLWVAFLVGIYLCLMSFRTVFMSIRVMTRVTQQRI